MAENPRELRISRRSWLLAGLAIPLSRAWAVDRMSVNFDGDDLRPVLPSLHFLAGRALDRLKDADTVEYISYLSLHTIDQSVPLRQIPNRFHVSYDILEERFKVAIPDYSRRSKEGLTAAQAEAWCMDNMAISASGLRPDLPFYLRLALRATDAKVTPGVTADPGISVRAMIETLIRKAKPGEQRWGPFDSRPMRLSEMVRTRGRGTRTW
jgi:hypothetical protein